MAEGSVRHSFSSSQTGTTIGSVDSYHASPKQLGVAFQTQQVASTSELLALGRGFCLLSQALTTGTHDVDDGRISRNPAQDGLDRLYFLQTISFRHVFHPFDFLIQGQLLIAVIIIKPAAELQS